MFLEGFNSARDRDWREGQQSRMQKFGIGMPFGSTAQKQNTSIIQQPTTDKLTPEDEKAFLEGFNKYREEDKAEQSNLQKARQAYVDMQNQTPKDTLRRMANGIGVQSPLVIKNDDLTLEDERAFLEGFNQYREDIEQPQVKEQEKPKSNKILDGASNVLTAASLIPGLDTFTNLASIPVDLMRGDYISTGLDLLGAIPFVGEIADVAKTARTADRIIDGVRTADKVVDGVRAADRAVDALEAVDDATDATRAIDDVVDVQKATDSSGLIENKRDMLLSKATNQKVKEAINQIYRPKAKIGDGGLGDAIRHELITGELVGGKSHMQKGKDRLKSLENILKKENLSTLEEFVVKDLIDDLKRALEGD